MNNKFVIIAQPRTGSTLVCWALASHPKIICGVEPINPKGHWHPMQPVEGTPKTIPQSAIETNLTAVLDTIYTFPPIFPINAKKKAEAIGFKIMIHQILSLPDQNKFWDYIFNNDIKIITVSRNNILLQYTSDMITLKTAQSACSINDELRTAKVMVEKDHMVEYIKHITNEKRYLAEKLAGRNHMHMVYEDFSTNYDKICDILPYIGMPRVRLNVGLVKQNSNDYSARVTNIAEFRQIVTELGLSNFL